MHEMNFPPIPGVHAPLPDRGAGAGKRKSATFVFDTILSDISKSEILAAPEFLGVHYLSTTEAPFYVISGGDAGCAGLKLELEEIPDLGGGKGAQFCLRINVEDADASSEATLVVLPRRNDPSELSEHAYVTQWVGGYRVRVLRCASILLNHTAKWVSDMQHSEEGYAVAVAIDRPKLPAIWTPAIWTPAITLDRDRAERGEGGEGERRNHGNCLAPMSCDDPPVNLWLSTKAAERMQISFGVDDDDSLDVQLVQTLLTLPAVLHFYNARVHLISSFAC